MYKEKIPVKRFTAGLLAMVLIFCLFMPTRAKAVYTGYTDVAENAWYADAVVYAKQTGLMSGTTTTTFSPNGQMTRAMLAVVLHRAEGEPEAAAHTVFADVQEDAWYGPAVDWAVEKGFLVGYGNGMFRPDDPVTREQIAAILWRYTGGPATAVGPDFADEASLSAFAVVPADWARNSGLFTGREGNLFDPQCPVIRAEVAVILMRYNRFIANQPPFDDGVPANGYDSTAFAVENAFLTYLGGTPSYVGVDVSSHQGMIDWERVAAAGVDFAMIRAGYRGYSEGRIYQDVYFVHNIRGALDAGLDVGIYFFSQAVNKEEAREEARQVLDWIEGYNVTYPIVFDWERQNPGDSRTRNTDGSTITACAMAFCEVIEAAGYTPMSYGSPYTVNNELYLAYLLDYPFWLAHYTRDWSPSSFRYHYHMWQYTSDGYVDGIESRVDLNLCLTDLKNGV